jgi:hypothetical protein
VSAQRCTPARRRDRGSKGKGGDQGGGSPGLHNPGRRSGGGRSGIPWPTRGAKPAIPSARERRSPLVCPDFGKGCRLPLETMHEAPSLALKSVKA